MPVTCAANFDNLQTVAKAKVGMHVTHLSASRMKDANSAIAFALGVDEES